LWSIQPLNENHPASPRKNFRRGMPGIPCGSAVPVDLPAKTNGGIVLHAMSYVDILTTTFLFS
jgi:hypothetical protein